MSSSQKEEQEEPVKTSLLSRCMLIVLKEKRSCKHESTKAAIQNNNNSTGQNGDNANSGGQSQRTQRNGQELFEEWQERNKYCYWNPHLEESVKNVKYIGCINPSTILVAGRDIYLDTVKSAWSRRVLRAPSGYGISKLGK